MQRANISAVAGILQQRCPRCRTGRIFRKSLFLFPGMHESCPACDLKFEREPGYFLGAMYIGYGLALATIAILSFLLWRIFHWPFQRVAVGGVVLFLPFAPFLTVMARVLWIYLDQTIDPDRSEN
ncbi:MAG: DUF983 domain-containing protein [Acidobacteriia bacterium]|nr:DUF983 domain-containing protein [Terriglobia bacterium]